MKRNKLQQIKSFINIVEKIRNSSFINENQRPSFLFNFVQGNPIKQTVAGFNENDLRSLLLDLRKLTLAQDEV